MSTKNVWVVMPVEVVVNEHGEAVITRPTLWRNAQTHMNAGVFSTEKEAEEWLHQARVETEGR